MRLSIPIDVEVRATATSNINLDLILQRLIVLDKMPETMETNKEILFLEQVMDNLIRESS